MQRAKSWQASESGQDAVTTVGQRVASFYSLKTKKISAKRLPLGEWLGRYRVSSGVDLPAWYGVGKHAGDDQGNRIEIICWIKPLFWGTPKSLQMVFAAMKLKDAYSLEEKLWPT